MMLRSVQSSSNATLSLCSQDDNGEWRIILTFETVIVACRVLVVFLPSLKTDLLPLGAAGVMTKVIVSRLADDVAVGPVVALAAHQPVLVLELPVVAVDPVVAGVQALAVQASVKQLGGVLT